MVNMHLVNDSCKLSHPVLHTSICGTLNHSRSDCSLHTLLLGDLDLLVAMTLHFDLVLDPLPINGTLRSQGRKLLVPLCLQ